MQWGAVAPPTARSPRSTMRELPRPVVLLEGFWRPEDGGTVRLYYDWNRDNYDLSLAQPNQTNRNTRFGFKVTGEF